MFSLVQRTILHFRQQLIPVILGVAVAGAVIVGALLIGDSVRGSLRHIAMDRIGKIDRVLLAPRWFSPSIIFHQDTDPPVHQVVYLQQATALSEAREQDEKTVYRANDMTLLGVDDSFWKLGAKQPAKLPRGEEVILNETLAQSLHVQVGSTITLRVSANSLVPAESALGKRDQDSFVLPRWEVIEILPDEGLARFSLRSDQRPPMNAFVDRSAIQNAIETQDKINAVFGEASPTNANQDTLLSSLHPAPSDLGLKLEQVTIPAHSARTRNASDQSGEAALFRYEHITSDQMLIADTVASTLLEKTKEFHPTKILTYLANGIEKKRAPDSPPPPGKSNVPYSTISAVDWSLLRSLLVEANTELNTLPELPPNDDWVVINQWLANELTLQVGDRLTIDYFLPETVEGEEVEKQFEVTVIAIAPLTEPKTPYRRNRDATFEAPPTPFNDPSWTPVVPGITDQESISKWDTPFPLKRTIDSRDDEYWNNHRLTPKLFLSYDLGKKLFGSRFGNITSLRYDRVPSERQAELQSIIQTATVQEMNSLGWRELPLRQEQLAKANGTTPFDALFMSLSFFLIAAALLLVTLLFQLSIERRATHWGLLEAVGWQWSSIRRLLLWEGASLAAVGATLGVALGIAYAYAMLSLLRSWWVGAITVSFLDLYVHPSTLILGWVTSFLAALLAIYIAARRIRRSTITVLLRGKLEEINPLPSQQIWPGFAYVAALLGGFATIAFSSMLQGQAQVGAFVGAGMLFLVAGVLRMWHMLQARKVRSNSIQSDIAFASSNASRAPTRSILAIALVAIASFLILSMSLFQASPSEPGMGGFYWLGKSSSPIHIELGNANARRENLGVAGDLWQDIDIVSMRVRGGDDASCNNLYQANEPQIFGISPRIAQIDDDKGHSRFAWFQTSDSKSNPWLPLETAGNGTRESPLPVVLDQNTALWALHLGGYVGEEFHFEFDDAPIYFKTVGVLQNTILQGGLIIGESNFQKVFPALTGYRAFLIRTPPDKITQADKLQSLLENGWEEQGLSLTRTESILTQLLAVQNTYLSAFQFLGSLGLMLGTIGLGITQLRSALERRSELAAMRAIGFSQRRLTWLLTLENAWQLLRGLVIGGVTASLAAFPALLAGQPFAGLVSPLFMLALIVAAGFFTSWIAAKRAMNSPLIASLRADT